MTSGLSTTWKKSSRSGAAGHCINVRLTEDGAVEFRDDEQPGIAPLRVSPPVWGAFLEGAKHGEFDLPQQG